MFSNCQLSERINACSENVSITYMLILELKMHTYWAKNPKIGAIIGAGHDYTHHNLKIPRNLFAIQLFRVNVWPKVSENPLKHLLVCHLIRSRAIFSIFSPLCVITYLARML